MKIFTSSIIVGLAFTMNLFSQVNSVDDKEFKSLTKYVISEIKKSGRSYQRSKNYVSESVISKVNFRGCEVEIEERFSQYDDFGGIDSKVSGSKEAGEITSMRHFSTNTSNFNLKDLDASLFEIGPAKEKDLVYLFLKTKNEDREIKSRNGKILRFVSKNGFLIRESESAKVLNSVKTLTKICQTK